MLTLSKNLTFSLASLVVILGLAFLAPSAMAGEFGVSLDMTDDMSTNGGLQLERSSAVDSDDNITLTVRFARAVTGAEVTKKISITTYDSKGVFVAVPKGTAAPAGEATTFTIKVPVPASVTTVTLKIAKGIPSADKFNDDTSGELKQTVHIIADDEGMPKVYSIRRVSGPLLPLGKDDTSVQVVITLSEKPREFKKDHISVTEADHGDPVALDPIAEETQQSLSRGLLSEVNLYAGAPKRAAYIRGLYNNPATGDTHDANFKVGPGIHDAINTLGPTDLTPTYVDPGAENPNSSKRFSLPTAKPNSDAAPVLVPPKTLASQQDAGAGYPVLLPAGTDRTVTPTKPKLADYNAGDAYKNAIDFYTSLKTMNDAYKTELTRHTAYTNAVKAEQAKDNTEFQEAYDEWLEEQNLPPLQRATGRNSMLHPYVVTLTPKFANKNNIVVRVKEFEDMTYPTPNKYMPPKTNAGYTEGEDQLTIKVGYQKTGADRIAGFGVHVPHGEGATIPANGYLLVAKNKDGSGIAYSHEKDHENKAAHQTPAQLMFNTRGQGGLPNLETFLANGGTIDLTTTTGAAMGSVVISEIMWGSDAARDNSTESQYIELHNTTASAIAIGDKNWSLWFYGANETLPTSGYVDRVGTRTLNADGTTLVFWSTQGKGMSGRTNNPGTGGTVVPTVATSPLVSMQRAMMADGTFANGTVAGNWTASVAPAVNFKTGIEGSYIGTPGAAPATIVTPPAPPPAPTPVPATPAATASDIGITEIMVDTGGGRLPQWIELTNLSSAAVSLSGWSAVIDNAADADVHGAGAPITVSLGDVELGVGSGIGNGDGQGQSVLLVAWASRNSGNFNAARVVNLATQLGQTGRYQLLSYKGFRITLVPKQTSPVLASGDDVGNLGMNWDLPMNEGGRSSLIRREMADGVATMGTAANGWKLASMTDLISGPTSWYGSDEDAGTPGYDSGGPLPVELSMFYPARDRLTGAVVIKWETQSELNNAGFFIKRSEARNGKFTVINPQMIAGAGTTSEKQSYTYTDTSAKPNVVYYYQIEDVSLDGQRQLLTIGTRLRGHIGAAGKATTIWGELKSQE